jgi:hypothetical protein
MKHTSRCSSAVFVAATWLACAGLARAQTQILEILGNQTGASYGAAVAGGYDFNGDGHDDVVIGAPNADAGGKTDNGIMRIVSGANGAALVTKVGDNDGDHFGYALAICGDVNGDGVHDVLVGAPDALVSGARRGLARVVSGANGATLRTLNGDDDGDKFGWSVDGGFDSNNDGVPDLIVGAPIGNFNGLWATGYARTFSGASGAALFTYDGTYPGGAAGWSVAALGDVDGDGRRDFAVGIAANNGSGSVRVYGGGTLTGAVFLLHSLDGVIGGSAFGSSIAGSLDVDQDGFSDVVVAAYLDDAPGATDAGAVRVYSGASGNLLRTWYGEATNQRFGASLAVIRDVNQKVGRELLVGAPSANYAVVLDAVNDEELMRIVGDATGDAFGSSVANGGDLNADGVFDFVVGASGFDVSGLSNAGQARVYSSRPWFVNYCTAGTTTNGCSALLSATGLPSVAASSGFVLSATGVEGAKSGLLFYGLSGREAVQWGLTTSWLCVKAPTQRTTVLDSGGAANSCNGVLALDWLSFLAANPGTLGAPLAAGQVVNAQVWFRDPPSPKTTHLSDALEFILVP